MLSLKGWAASAALVIGFSLSGARAEAPLNAKAEAIRVLNLFKHEPSILDVQKAAARYAQVNPGAYGSWLAESTLANTLPRRLAGRVRTVRNDDRSARTTNASTGSLSDTVSARDQVQLEVLAEWDLSRLVFNRDAILAARQIERIVNQREDILTTVNKVYFARRQLQADSELDTEASVQRRIQQQLQIDGLTADLDALTGGWFSNQLDRKRQP